MKVLIYYKQFNSFLAGGAFLPLKFVAEIQKTCDVTFALNGDADIRHAAEMSGVPIDADRLRVVRLDSENPLIKNREWLASILRIRRLKILARDADICISTANVMDFGKPGHHFVYLLSQFEGAAFYDYIMGRRGGFGARRILRRIGTAFYEKIVKPIFGVRPLKRIIADQREHIYPTSVYVENVLRGYFGSFNSSVFYPPTTFEFNDITVKRDPLLAIYVGRIFPPKKITDIIDIVDRARTISGKDIKLHIAGQLHQSPYIELLQDIERKSPWLKLVGPVYGKEKEAFMLSATYAIHAERDEAFGIAIAEYIKAGCIPIIPDEGGPTEIVDDHALEFHTNEDAAATLTRLINDQDFHCERLRHCTERAKEFSCAAYMARQHAVVAKMLSCFYQSSTPIATIYAKK